MLKFGFIALLGMMLSFSAKADEIMSEDMLLGNDIVTSSSQTTEDKEDKAEEAVTEPEGNHLF